MHLLKSLSIGFILLFAPLMNATAEDKEIEAFHMGIFHPNGVDLLGYSSERKVNNNIYSYYTFGFPSFAAIGYNYYQEYQGSGITGTIGGGIGSIFYVSLAYQFHIGMMNYMKLGAGYTEGLVYAGGYPVFSIERRY